MNRTPPDDVKRALRQEVNYGCPVQGCGEPFLEWHHFDPPWNEKEHHDPEGMIALCPKHHRQADGNVFSKEQLKEMKKNPNLKNWIIEKFPWLCKSCLIRLGGTYSVDECVVTIKKIPIIKILANPETNYREISFLLRNPRDSTKNLSGMINNQLYYDIENSHDIEIAVSGNRIKVWRKVRDIGFELSYSRLNIEELEKILKKDSETCKYSKPLPICDINELYKQLREIEDYKNLFQLMKKYNDNVGIQLRWETSKRLDEDGLISLINFENAKLTVDEKTIEMRNGSIKGDIGRMGYSVMPVYNL